MLALLLVAEVLYGVACGVFGSRPGAPRWLSWPLPIWRSIKETPRRPAPARPDYDRIERLERELGMAQPEPPMRPDRVCLTKDCRGDWTEVRSWAGPVLNRVHTCEAP